MSWPWAPPGGPPPPPQFGVPLPPPPPFRGGPPAPFGAAPPLPHFDSGFSPPVVQAPHGQFAETDYPSRQYIAYGQSTGYPPYQGRQHLSQPLHPPQSQYQHFTQQQPYHQFSYYAQQSNRFHGQQQFYNNRHAQSQYGSQIPRVNSQHQCVPKHPQNARTSPSNAENSTAADAANPHKSGNHGKSRNVDKELALTRQVLAKLGRKLPGDNPDEIARYIAERKRNWPRASRVISAPSKPAPADALAQLAEGYADGCSEAEGDDTRRDPKSEGNKQRVKRRRKGRGRDHTERTRGPSRKKLRPVLLEELLRKDILKERHVLLQAIAHMLERIDAKVELKGSALLETIAVKESGAAKEGEPLQESRACDQQLVSAKDAQKMGDEASNLLKVVEHNGEVSKEVNGLETPRAGEDKDRCA